MQNGYRTQASVMTSAAQHVDDVNQQVRSKLDRLRQEIESAASGWKGPAGAKLQVVMQRYDNDARQLNDALHGIAERMRRSRDVYQRTQQQTTETLSKIEQALGS